MPTAFLSYTHKDDEFFGGYISAFRKSLEIGVHVVTGEETFKLFQDIDGIVIGEQWRKKISEVIDAASFLVPMLSPLFLNSKPCREEVELFLKHEASAGRDDLILPVYFIESPKLEKPEEMEKDRIAREIGRRHRFDWRATANVSLQEPASRDAILRLARAIGAAIERVETPAAPIRAASGDGHVPLETSAEFARALVQGGTLGPESRRTEPSERSILWVDDAPSNNAWERRALESYGMRFVLAPTTDEAIQQLRSRSFDAIISDLVRRGDSEAGFTLLQHLRAAGHSAPVFIYCGRQAPRIAAESLRRGATLVTNDPDELVAAVVASIRPTEPGLRG